MTQRGSVAEGRTIAALPTATAAGACLGARFYNVSQGKPGEANDQTYSSLLPKTWWEPPRSEGPQPILAG